MFFCRFYGIVRNSDIREALYLYILKTVAAPFKVCWLITVQGRRLKYILRSFSVVGPVATI